jgi:hypothetical protein
MSPNAIQEIARDLASLSQDKDKESESPIPRDENETSKVFDVSNIEEDLEVEDVTIKFGNSVYDHVNISKLQSPLFGSDGKVEELDSFIASKGTQSAQKREQRDQQQQDHHSPQAHHDIEEGEEENDIDDDGNTSRSPPLTNNTNKSNKSFEPHHDHHYPYHYPNTHLTTVSWQDGDINKSQSMEDHQREQHGNNFPSSSSAANGHSTHKRNSPAIDQSMSSSYSPAGDIQHNNTLASLSFHSSSFIYNNQAEIETYKMKYNTIHLKYSILKTDYEQLSEKLQVTINENSTALSELKREKVK